MARVFGTNGVRGLANAELTPELALSVATSTVSVLGGRRPVAVVGRDPRVSGDMLEAAVVAGLTASGADVLRAGVLPTPGLAYLVGALDAHFGLMISASHNPMPYNGIKIFGAGGEKLPDGVEDDIAAELPRGRFPRPTGAQVGRIHDVGDAVDVYVDHLLACSPQRLDGLRLVVDCADGAASRAAPRAYARAGAEVTAIHAAPDGVNINEGCGCTHLEALRSAVVDHKAQVGIAHDGDADRCLAVDADGAEVDGDQILAVLALALHDRGELARNTLVTTVMSNLGLRWAMGARGIDVRSTAVGDRHVLEELRSGGFSLGGEQCGHVVLPELATTGDGLLTALRLMVRIVETGRSLAELAGIMPRVPQVLVNVPVRDTAAASTSADVLAEVHAVESELGDTGRVLLRPSGTEQCVRVMVEASSRDVAQQSAQRLAGIVAGVR